jgi:hypothetical protein
MALQQPLSLPAFHWRLDWFPPNFYIRVCPKNRLIDVMDVFTLVSSSHGAAKTLQSKFLGASTIEETKKRLKFTDADLRRVMWESSRGQRKALPLDIMKAVVKEVQTQVAAKLVPDLDTVFDDVTDGAIVAHWFTETEQQATGIESGALTAYKTLPCFNSNAFQLNPYNCATNAVCEQVDRANAQFELQKVTASAMEHASGYKRREELATAEHAGKKAKIEAEVAHEEWKLKLSRLNEKYEWATSKNKEQLARHIEDLIAEM